MVYCLSQSSFPIFWTKAKFWLAVLFVTIVPLKVLRQIKHVFQKTLNRVYPLYTNSQTFTPHPHRNISHSNAHLISNKSQDSVQF
mgnify:FL=1